MTTSPRSILEALPGVVVRRLATREGFFTAGRMFALLSRHSVLLRLPARAGADLHARFRGRMLVNSGVPAPNAWVELSIAAQAHEAVRLLSRRASRRRAETRRRRSRSGR